MSLKAILLTTVSLCVTLQTVFVSSQCTSQTSVSLIRAYVRSFDECQKDSASIFQYDAPLLDNLYDLETDAFTGNIDYDELDTFCGSLKTCKEALTVNGNCDAEMKMLFSEMGSALCSSDGKVKREAVSSAISSLKNENCDDVNLANPNAPTSSGCENSASISTDMSYLEYIEESRRRIYAGHRCTFRWLQRYQCSAASAQAYAVVIAASQPMEIMKSSFDAITSYDQAITVLPRDTVATYGLTHVDSYRGEAIQTCSLQGDNVLLFNTYMIIDGTIMWTIPGSEGPAFLSAVTITFRNNDGTTLETYQATYDAEVLSVKLSGSQSQKTVNTEGDETVTLTKLDDGSVRLIHSVSGTSIQLSQSVDGLQVFVRVPTELLNKESSGILVNGCPTELDYSMYVDGSNDEADCSQTCQKSDQSRQCVFDCVVNDASKSSIYKAIKSRYTSISSTDDLVKPVSASEVVSSSIALLVTAVLLSLF